MKYNLLSAFTILLLTILLGITVAQAYSVDFIFTKHGDFVDVPEYLDKGDETLAVEHNGGKTYDIFGLSLSKKTLFSYSFISRCDYQLTGTTNVSCTWKDREQGNYKGTVVMSDMFSKGEVKGSATLYTSVIKK